FHHAFRGGDLTINLVMETIAKMGFKNLTLASSSLSDCHAPLVESKQVRRAHRVEIAMPGAIAREDGHLFSCTVHDFSDGGLGI
ncbi:hypothetical protein ONJ87_27890, partial [Salmonella enterica subsp. enterica serovar Anatum]|nr:hypothetical protein [Salmonella enterica subsp. enterica serovar Anatum]